MDKILTCRPVQYKLASWALLIGIMAIPIIISSGCSSSKQVTRVAAETTIDLSGRWNDTDSRMVADEIIGDCLSHAWIINHMSDAGRETRSYCWRQSAIRAWSILLSGRSLVILSVPLSIQGKFALFRVPASAVKFEKNVQTRANSLQSKRLNGWQRARC